MKVGDIVDLWFADGSYHCIVTLTEKQLEHINKGLLFAIPL